MASHNIEQSHLAKTELDTGELFHRTGKDKEYSEFKSCFNEIQETLDKISYGGNMTAQRRDKLIDLLFKFRKLCEAQPSELNELADNTSKKFRSNVIYALVGYASSALTLAYIATITSSHQTTFPSALAGIAIVLLLPFGIAYFVLKALKVMSYKKESRNLMRRIYSLDI